jgi:signal transduction histidine kinase
MTSKSSAGAGQSPLEISSLGSILEALPFAVYGIDSNLTILYNNGRDVLRGFLSDEEDAPPQLLGSNLLDHVPPAERDPLGRLLNDVLHQSARGNSEEPRGVEFLQASAKGLQRLRVLASRVAGSPRGVAAVLTCHESAVNAAPVEQTPAGTARLDVARQLAATLNHEINNPLFIVSATLEDLLAEATDPASERRLRAALDAVWRVASAVKQLQDIRHIVTTAYIEGLPMVDLGASSEAPRSSE